MRSFSRRPTRTCLATDCWPLALSRHSRSCSLPRSAAHRRRTSGWRAQDQEKPCTNAGHNSRRCAHCAQSLQAPMRDIIQGAAHTAHSRCRRRYRRAASTTRPTGACSIATSAARARVCSCSVTAVRPARTRASCPVMPHSSTPAPAQFPPRPCAASRPASHASAAPARGQLVRAHAARVCRTRAASREPRICTGERGVL